MSTPAFIITIVLSAILLSMLAFLFVAGWVIVRACQFFPLWFEARIAGVELSMRDLFMMHFQRLNPREFYDSLKVLAKAGVEVSCAQLQRHVLSGGHLDTVRRAAVAVDKAGLRIGFPEIARLDLAGRNPYDAVNAHVNPVTLSCTPSEGQCANGIVGVAKDGIALAVQARVTLRTRLDRLIGGASEQTIIARIGEGIVKCIGRAQSHREILENPSGIAEMILSRSLERETCFEVLSLDIEDVTIIDNIAARLQSLQADADARIANARFEERRAAAVASGQEMLARTREKESRLIDAETALPRSEAHALRVRHFGSRRPMRPLLPAIKWQ